MTTVIAADRVVTGAAVYEPGWVEVDSPGPASTVLAVGEGTPRDLGDRELRQYPGGTIVPGFVDIHVHGGGGGSYTDLSRESALRARAAHLARGTTTSMASLVTDTPERMLEGVRMLADLADEGEIRGIHLEGPWLSEARCGAHPPELLRDPRPVEIEALLEAGRGHIRMVTVAPEREGAIAAIERLTAAGVVAAIGHTDADYETTRRAIDAGATVATHLFNAMRPVHHREPGPVVALMRDRRVVVELIADGVHCHPELVAGVIEAVGALRVALVTDAMSAAGLGDGGYRLGALDVVVEGGVARLAGADTIAGSTVTMDALFRSAVAAFASAEADLPGSGAAEGAAGGAPGASGVGSGGAAGVVGVTGASGSVGTAGVAGAAGAGAAGTAGAGAAVSAGTPGAVPGVATVTEEMPVIGSSSSASATSSPSRRESVEQPGVSKRALLAAARQTAGIPARALGWNDVGELAPGRRADLVVLDDGLRVVEVMAAGRFVAR